MPARRHLIRTVSEWEFLLDEEFRSLCEHVLLEHGDPAALGQTQMGNFRRVTRTQLTERHFAGRFHAAEIARLGFFTDSFRLNSAGVKFP